MSRYLLSLVALSILGSLPLSAHGWERRHRWIPPRPRPVVVFERDFCPPPVVLHSHRHWHRHGRPGVRFAFVP